MRSRRATCAASLQCEVKFCSAKLHVIAPLAFGIEAERNDGEEVAARSSTSEIKDVLSGSQALIRVCGIAGLIFVIAESQRSRHATGKVGTDQRVGLYLA